MDVLNESAAQNWNSYCRRLLKQYYEATGCNNKSFDYVYRWFEDRKNTLDDYAYWLTQLRENGERWTTGFLDNTVEVGNTGLVNSVSDYLSPIDVVSPYGWTMDKENSYTGVISFSHDKVEFEKTRLSSQSIELPKLDLYQTFITHNPDFESDKMCLDALRILAWQRPNIAVSIICSAEDRNIKQKQAALRNYKAEILSYKNKYVPEELRAHIIGPIVREKEYEKDRTYINTIITDQYVKLLGPKVLIKSRLDNLPMNIQSARYLGQVRSKGMGGR